MWFQETIINWIQPFTNKYYIWFLFKYNSQYWAIQSRVEKIFDNSQDDFRKLFIENFKNQIPSPYDKLINNLFDWDLWENVEIFKDEVLNHPTIWNIISEYFLYNSDFQKLSNKIFINLQSFRDTFDSQIWISLKWEKINEKLLKKEKEYAIKFLLDWVKEIEKIYFKQFFQFKTDIEPRLIFNSPLPLTNIELDDLNQKMKELSKNIEDWKNHKFYQRLVKIIDRIFDEMIDIIK